MKILIYIFIFLISLNKCLIIINKYGKNVSIQSVVFENGPKSNLSGILIPIGNTFQDLRSCNTISEQNKILVFFS